MTKIRQELIGRVLEGLEGRIDPAQADVVRQAVAGLPRDAFVTTAAIDALGLPDALEATLIFELLLRAHPDEVKSQAYAATTLAGVFQAVMDASPAVVDGFFDRLLLDGEQDDLGDPLPARVRAIDNAVTDVEARTVTLDVALHRKGTVELTLRAPERDDGPWTYQLDGGDKQRLAELDLDSLDDLGRHLATRAEGGAKDPLLNLLRGTADAKQGGLLSEAVSVLERLHSTKRDARFEHLAAIDAALREHLGPHAVGVADKQKIDAIAEAAMREHRGSEDV